jgi:hypothetical protein
VTYADATKKHSKACSTKATQNKPLTAKQKSQASSNRQHNPKMLIVTSMICVGSDL